MRFAPTRRLLFLATFVLAAPASAQVGAIDYAALLPPPVERNIDFVKDVQPILRAHCYECHAEGNEEGGLNLGARSRAIEGGDHGPAWISGQSAKSRLIHLVAGIDKESIMPPEGDPLSKEHVGVLRAWIDQGARWPVEIDPVDPRIERAREHWAFQKLNGPDLPGVNDSSWPRTPIDHFVLERLEASGLEPSRPAELPKLVRRLYFDVTGLPPLPQEIAAICKAENPQAEVEALVDRLLNSPEYGERWGRHWLDVARYADSCGQEGDADRPHAWRYRDFVIGALNDDMPFDQFVRWQIAGDEYEPENPQAAVATGFLTAGPSTLLEPKHLEEERLRLRYDELDDMLSTVGSGILGLTVGCARCHDHKYDAISSREYYRLLAALHSGDRQDVKLSDGQEAFVFRDLAAEPKTTWLFSRGDFYDRRRPVTLGFLEVLSTGRAPEEYLTKAREEATSAQSTYQRKALADWMTDVEHGAGALAARVIVNRICQHYFGAGLVRTPSDFGVRSEPPTHPLLLEWLANDLVKSGWRLKRLHRQILLSAVYQQASNFDEAKATIDPENRLLWRMKPRRLEAEIVRDAMLAAASTLNRQRQGPGFKPPIAGDAMVARNLKTPYPTDVKEGPEHLRRSVYMFHKRVIPYPLLQAFDRPDALQSCSRRDATIVAPQALALLNDPFVRRRAREFADRLLQVASDGDAHDTDAKDNTAEDDDAELVKRAYQLALSRLPSDTESQASREFLDSQLERRRERDASASTGDLRRLAVADFCQTLFSLNEFIFVD